MTFGNMQFYANSYAFISVLLIILELAILAVMLRVENKSTATRFLTANHQLLNRSLGFISLLG